MPNTTEIIEMLRVLDSTCKPESIEWVAKIAADAIEELLITTSAQKETIGDLRARNSAQADMLDGEWISVEERLPEENYAVLGYCQKNQCVFTVFRQGEHWMHFAEHTTPVFYPVTHWMQLPESPKEVE